MRIVSYADVRVALACGSLVCVYQRDSDDSKYGARRAIEATYQEEVFDPNTGTTLTRACMCPLIIEQYDELRAMGAVEGGLMPRL